MAGELRAHVTNLRRKRLIPHRFVVTFGVLAFLTSFIVSVAALSVSLVSLQHQADASKAAVKTEISEQCSLYAQVGNLQPTLSYPVTSAFAVGLVMTMRYKFTSLGCTTGLKAPSKALIVLDERYHIPLTLK